jgi:hypothetical protein
MEVEIKEEKKKEQQSEEEKLKLVVSDYSRYRYGSGSSYECPTRLFKIVYVTIGDVFNKKSKFYNKDLIYTNFKEGEVISDPKMKEKLNDYPLAREFGIHGCKKILDCFHYRMPDTPFVLCEISPTENTLFDYSHTSGGFFYSEVWALSEIKINKIYSKEEVLSLCPNNHNINYYHYHDF